MDIRPPRKRPSETALRRNDQAPIAPAQPSQGTPPQVPVQRPRSKRVPFIFAGLGLLLLGSSLSTLLWYNWAVSPRSDSTAQVRVVVEPGATSATIAKTLHDHELIRSQLAFNVYTQVSGTRGKLQAGGYVLSPNQPVSSIVEHMVSGKTDEFNITILPGLTLKELRKNFLQNGFSDAEITDAFEAEYNHPLLATKPANATLEGYIYPETYRMNADQPLNDLLMRSFDEMYEMLRDKKYLDEFAKRTLTLHNAITLASIVQKEVENPRDQKQVAQVFLKRLGDGIQLGSDVTYMYAADQMGVEGTPGLESPYNTRKYTGLPPGPISNMNPGALEAIAFPAAGDFVYFVAGDDGVTYFSRTEAEHEANVAAHCTTLCQ